MVTPPCMLQKQNKTNYSPSNKIQNQKTKVLGPTGHKAKTKTKKQKNRANRPQTKTKIQVWGFGFWLFEKPKTKKTKVSGPIRPGTPNQNQNWGFGFWVFEKPTKSLESDFVFSVKTKTKKPVVWSQIFLFFGVCFFEQPKTKTPNLDFGFGLWPVGPIFLFFGFCFCFVACWP